MTADTSSYKQPVADEKGPNSSDSDATMARVKDTLERLHERFENMEKNADDTLERTLAKAGGVATLAMSAVFNDVALPPGFLERYSELITWMNRVAGDLSIGNGAGTVDEKTKQERQEEADQKSQDAFRDQLEFIERQQEQEREAAWDRQKHDFAGMDLTGEEIDSIIDVMSDPAKRQKLIERRAKEKGISVQEAEEDVDKAQRYGELFKKHEKGTATADEEKEYGVLKSDQAVEETIKSARAVALEDTVGPATVASQKAQTSARTSESVAVRANMLDVPFSTAPALKEEFAEAKGASEPLDAEKPLKSPTLVASAERAAPPPQVASTGFDV